MIELVLVDFDDTLVDTAPRFQNARRALISLMTDAGFTADAAYDMLYNRVDPGMRETWGLGPRRMEPAFVETYRQLTAEYGVPFDEDIARRASELGRGCYGAAPAFAGAVDALRRLSAVHPTVIYTQSGDLDYQRGCVRDSGIADIVTDARVHVCGRKDVDTFRRTLETFDVADPGTAWMIGNSMRSDINPALEAGANAILVESADPWEFDMAEPVSPRFHRVASFSEAVDLLVPS
jgi:putative hydrolase of the HAD superfamily